MLANSSTRGAPAGTCSDRSFGAKHATRVVRGFNVPTSRAQKTFQSHDASFHVLCAKQPSRGGKPGAGGDSGGKRNATSGGNPQQTTSAPRITGKVGSMSVHTQIKLVERYKRLSGGSTHSSPGSRSTGPGGGKAGTAVVRRASVEKNTFRKTKDDAYQEELARRRRAAQAEVRHQNTLESFGGIGAAPVLLVDGYNVCACDEGETFSDMKQAFMAGDLETAQRLLINDLETLAAHKGYRVICVFDADRTARASNGLDQASKTTGGVWVVFSVTNDADSWIEAASLVELKGESSLAGVLRKTRDATGGKGPSGESQRLASREDDGVETVQNAGLKIENSNPPKLSTPKSRTVYVATSDGALSSVVRGNGAYAVSAGSLIEELRAAQATETEILRELAVKARWGGEKRGAAMRITNQTTADALMELYKNAPNTSAVVKFGSQTGAGFAGRPKKGKKNKPGKEPVSGEQGTETGELE